MASGIDGIWKYGMLLAAVAVLGCGGSTEPQKGGGDDDDDSVGDDDDDDTAGSESGTFNPTEPFEPAAVGFELDAVVTDTQELVGYNGGPWVVQTGDFQPPTLILTFASAAYFEAGSDQDAESCIMFGEWVFPLPLVKPDQIPLQGATVLYASWDGAFNLQYHTCAGKVTPETWGADAEILQEKFYGAHVGIGFGPLTDYLADTFGEDTITDLGDALLTEYIAINDVDGNFIGQDWTAAIAFEYDDVAEELVVEDVDGESLLVKVPVDGLAPGDDLPQAYYRSFAYWYQDFPYMDLDNLTEGAPALP